MLRLLNLKSLRPNLTASASSSPIINTFLLPKPFSSSSSSSSSFSTTQSSPSVAVFWDLKDINTNCKSLIISPYDAAVRLRLAASSFGRLRFIAAFADHNAFRLCSVSPQTKSHYLVCRICGRRFSLHSKLLHHFDHTHRPDHVKRLNRLNSSRGAHRLRLAAHLSPNITRFNKAASEISAAPRDKYRLSEELSRAGVLVKRADDDVALREHVVGAMERGRIGCLMLVSDDIGLVDVLKEARMRRLMTVVICGDGGDKNRDGAQLKRHADAGYSWRDVVSGKARMLAGSAVGKWKDKGLLTGLEWRYEHENDSGFEGESEEDDDDGSGGESLNLARKQGSNEPWWKLDMDRSVMR